jgi:16S rRNA (cytidine1402-2'-O)-methyltransferase
MTASHDVLQPQADPDAARRVISKSLYVVATPLGNLADISTRAVAILRAVDVIAAEDTRTSGVLLAHHGIATRLIAAHQHNESASAQGIVKLLDGSASVALISDAGTPGISDPGARIVRAVRAAGHTVIPIPGPSAVTAALSASGLDGNFHFVGFLSTKPAAREAALKSLLASNTISVLYEAPHRIADLAREVAQLAEPTRRIVIARELSKRFETIVEVSAATWVDYLEADADRRRGEFVVMIDRAPDMAEDALSEESLRVLALLQESLPLSEAVRLSAAITGAKRKLLYAHGLKNPSGRASSADS